MHYHLIQVTDMQIFFQLCYATPKTLVGTLQISSIIKTSGGLAIWTSEPTSAVRYSRIAALYTAAVAPTRPWLVVRVFKCLWIRPTGNWKQMNPVQRVCSKASYEALLFQDLLALTICFSEFLSPIRPEAENGHACVRARIQIRILFWVFIDWSIKCQVLLQDYSKLMWEL